MLSLFTAQSSIHDIELLKDLITVNNKRSFIHIVGAHDVGKTTLGINIPKLEPNSLFLYVDTAGSLHSELDIDDNVYILRTNEVNMIESFLESVDKNYIKAIIIDSLHDLVPEKESFHSNVKRYDSFHEAVNRLLDACYKKAITVIALNGYNGQNKPIGYSSQLRKLINFDLSIESSKLTEDYNFLTLKNNVTNKKEILKLKR